MLQLDKQAHAWAGMAIYGLSVVVLPPLYSLLPVLAAGIGKELWDRRTHPADWLDAGATVAGGLIAFAWGWLLK